MEGEWSKWGRGRHERMYPIEAATAAVQQVKATKKKLLHIETGTKLPPSFF